MRNAFASELENLIAVLASFLPGTERRQRAQALLAQLVGAIVLARALGRSVQSAEILEAVRAAIALPGQAAT